jgi:hypothetical protein
MLDSRNADTNEYYGNPIARVSADVIQSMTDSESVGKMVQMQGKESMFEYVPLPGDSPTKEAEKNVLTDSILMDTLTPSFHWKDTWPGWGRCRAKHCAVRSLPATSNET